MPHAHALRRLSIALFLAGLFLNGSTGAQTTVELVATRDNTLYEDDTGTLSNGAGSHFFAGRTQNGELRRALVAFDDLAQIPGDSVVTEAVLRLSVTRSIVGVVRVNAHAVTEAWGEGDSNASGQEGAGADAAAGDATWIHRFFDDEPWSSPGGDFAPEVVATADVGTSGPHDFTGERLAELVQRWLDDGDANEGLLLLAESLPGTTAKRFSSREGSAPPVLAVTFMPREQAPPRVVNISGLWFDPALEGEGYNVIQSSAGLTIFYYGYASDGTRLWLVSETLDTAVTTGETLTLNLFRGTPGSFDQPSSSTELETWGTLSLTVSECDQARFELLGDDGMKVSNAILLASISGVACEAD